MFGTADSFAALPDRTAKAVTNRTRRQQAQAGSALTGLSVCDVPLRNLVRATELHELAEVRS